MFNAVTVGKPLASNLRANRRLQFSCARISELSHRICKAPHCMHCCGQTWLWGAAML